MERFFHNPLSWAIWKVQPQKQTLFSAAITNHLLHTLLNNFAVNLMAISW
jgi:hypothetical protein